MDLLQQQLRALVAHHGFSTVLQALYYARTSYVSQDVRVCIMEAIVKLSQDERQKV